MFAYFMATGYSYACPDPAAGAPRVGVCGSVRYSVKPVYRVCNAVASHLPFSLTQDDINMRYVGVTEGDYEWVTDQITQVANK